MLAARYLRSLGIQTVLLLLVGWASEELERRRVDELLKTTVDPEVDKALKTAGPAAERLGEEDPFQPVYANIALDMTYRAANRRCRARRQPRRRG